MTHPNLCALSLLLVSAACEPTPPPAAPPAKTTGYATPSPAAAQAKPAQPAGQPTQAARMPAGHPTSMPTTGGAKAANAMPPGHPPMPTTGGAKAANAMPPGHPPMPGGGSLPGHAATAPRGLPTSMPTNAGGRAANAMPPGHPPMPGGDVQGTVRLDAKLKGDVKAGAALFLIARRDTGGQGKGMLLAAKKVVVTGPAMFPMPYTLTQADVMMQGTQLNGVVTVTARVDNDGDALSKNPGDLTGAHGKAVPVGSKKVDLTLDTKL